MIRVETGIVTTPWISRESIAVFSGFAGVWTPLVPARELGHKPLRVPLAGEAIVLFRGEGDDIGALLDRCPHRGAALSLGHVGDDGCLECPYHGWRFNTAGDNCHVPLNPEAKRHLLGATALPVRRYGDLIWLHTAVGTDPPPPTVPEGLIRAGLARTYVTRTWHCHWTRAMENMLDSAHLPFVHRRTIGRPLRHRMNPDSDMTIAWEPTPFGGRAYATLDGEPGPACLEFFRPNMMALHIPLPGRDLRIHALVIPEAKDRTRLIVVGSRDFARLRLLNPWFSWLNGRIADEDKAVVETAGTDEVPNAASEHSVATDRATLKFRKYYYESLRQSDAGRPAASSPSRDDHASRESAPGRGRP